MDKFTFIALWDIYRGLLTETQREVTDMYFNLDLTVSEIAEQKGISRQAVSECLKGCKKQLEDYEEKLGLRARINELNAEIERLKGIKIGRFFITQRKIKSYIFKTHKARKAYRA